MHLLRKDMPTMAGRGLRTKRLSKVFWWACKVGIQHHNQKRVVAYDLVLTKQVFPLLLEMSPQKSSLLLKRSISDLP